MHDSDETRPRNLAVRYLIVPAMVLLVLSVGSGVILYFTGGICDVTMVKPGSFLRAHDVIGVGVLEKFTVVRRLGPCPIYYGSDTADAVVMLYRMRPVDVVKEEVDTVVHLWRVEAEGRRSTLRPEMIWRIGDTLVFYGEYLTGRDDARRLVSRDSSQAFVAAQLELSLSGEDVLALSTPHGALIVEHDGDLWDLNYFRKFCYWNGNASRTITTEDYMTLLRNSPR
jgi:hypothetical protein